MKFIANTLFVLGAAWVAVQSSLAFSHILVVASDHKLELVNGEPTVVQHSSPDTVTIVDIDAAIP